MTLIFIIMMKIIIFIFFKIPVYIRVDFQLTRKFAGFRPQLMPLTARFYITLQALEPVITKQANFVTIHRWSEIFSV